MNSTIAQSSFKGKILLAICASEKTFVKESEYSISLNRNYRDDQFKITMKSLSDVAVNFCSLCSLFFPETSKQKKKKSKT